MKNILKNTALAGIHAYYRIRLSRAVVRFLNLPFEWRFKLSKFSLSKADSLIVEEVRNNGYAVRFLSDFFDPEIILEIESKAFKQRSLLMSDSKFERRADFEGKSFLRRSSELDNRITLEDPLVQFVVQGRANHIARHYFGQEVKICNIDYWLNLPLENGGPTSSQKWHRDFEDRRVLKAFVYLTDVNESNGPLSYLSGSQPGGRYESIFPTRPPLGVVVEDEQLSVVVDPTSLQTFILPRLAVVFADTAGLHRGGYCTSGIRFAFTTTFTTFAGLSNTNFVFK